MHRRLLVTLLMGVLMMGSAHGCSRAFAIDLTFAEGSAALDRVEIVRLAVWLNRWKMVFPRLKGVSIDGIAPANARDPKALAKRRATVTMQAVRQLLEDVPIDISSHLSSPPPSFKDGNYVGIDLIPFQEDIPGCGKPIK